MHSFDPRVAGIVGVNAAVIYQNILFWAQKNAANKKHIMDGRVWTYNSRAAFGELFPYLSDSQIKTALSKLIDAGLLIKGDYNKANYDRTNWYSPVEIDVFAIGQKSPMDRSEIANGLVKNRQPIPDSKPDIKPDGKPIARTRGDRVLEILCAVMSQESAQAFIEHRKHKRSKLTERAAQLIAKKLAGNQNADAIIEKSIMNGWTGVFPESFKSDEGNNTHGKSKHDGAAISRAERAEQRQRERYAEKQRWLDIGQNRNPSQPLLPAGQPGRGIRGGA